MTTAGYGRRMCGYQPQYFPRLHYMNRVLESDVFEISDYVQFVRKHAYPQADGTMSRGKSYQAHAVIKTAQGPLFLAVPTKGSLRPINRTEVDYSQHWAVKQLRSIEMAYRRARNFRRFYPELEAMLLTPRESISDLSVATIMWSILRLSNHTSPWDDGFSIAEVEAYLQCESNPYRLREIFLASQSEVPPPEPGRTNEWCVALCRYAKADVYVYGGTGGAAYMKVDMFAEAGIDTVLQKWSCMSYPQQFSAVGFVENLSALDLILNASEEECARVVGGTWTRSG
jgi:WbqC-like protein family